MGSDGGATGARLARTRVTLTDISSRAWEHPADRGALNALRQLRGFDVAMKKLFGLWNERALRLEYLGSAIRVDHRQHGRVHGCLVDAALALDVRAVPELYVYADPRLHAMAIGLDSPFVVVTSGLVDLLDDDELRFVLGHELGHVCSGHALYTTMLLRLLRMSGAWSWIPFGAVGLRALIAALYEWQRKAELSGDRAGLLAVQDPAAVQRCHMKLAGAGRLDDLDVTAFRTQGDEYLRSPDVRDSLLKMLLVEARTHPFVVVRAAELRRWVDEGAYTRILGGDYPRRTDDGAALLRGDVENATRHYAAAFSRSQDALTSLVRDLGGGLTGVKDWATGLFGGRPRG